MQLIDLFAGCGGLSLGLKEAGFKTVLANELEKNACLTYNHNFKSTKLIEGDISKVLNSDQLDHHLNMLKKEGYKNKIDLVAGGPPCQGYSQAGRRKSEKVSLKYIADNRLYKEMIRVIEYVEPRVFLLENVLGLLSARWKKNDRKPTVFMDLWDEFNKKLGTTYMIRPHLLKASDFGVPQRRVRFFLIGIKKKEIKYKFDYYLKTPYINSPSDIKDMKMGFFAFKSFSSKKAPDPKEVISDLNFNGWKKEHPHHQMNPQSDFQRKLRKKTKEYQEQFLWNHEETTHTQKAINRFKEIQQGMKPDKLPKNLKSKKITQRALQKEWKNRPNITITSMPDDLIHYDKPRILTVRECARFQTFPDYFKFCGVRTIGGKKRGGSKTEEIERTIPQYTQVANAVPPLLAKALGKMIKNLLK